MEDVREQIAIWVWNYKFPSYPWKFATEKDKQHFGELADQILAIEGLEEYLRQKRLKK